MEVSEKQAHRRDRLDASFRAVCLLFREKQNFEVLILAFWSLFVWKLALKAVVMRQMEVF